MFDNVLNNALLNRISVRALDFKPGMLKTLFIVFMLIISLLFFAIEVLIKKIAPRTWFDEDSFEEPQIKTAS